MDGQATTILPRMIFLRFELRTPNSEPRTQNPEPRTETCSDRRRRSTEPRTQNPELRTPNPELRTKNLSRCHKFTNGIIIDLATVH